MMAGAGGAIYPFTGLSDIRHLRRDPAFLELVQDCLQSIRERRGRFRDLETISRDAAQQTFIRLATEFLATRLAAERDFENSGSMRWAGAPFLHLKQIAGGQRVSTPGCHFTVSSDSSGLRVYWSGAYRLSPNYFSHPTTPAHSVLQAGNYVFGIDGGAYGNQIQWNLGEVVSLPGCSHVHLKY